MANIIKKEYSYKYPHPAVTADCVILTFHEGVLKVLLIRRGIEPFKGQWALPGGFMRIEESAEECALRELREETGVTGCPIRQFHTFSRPDRDPRERVVTIGFYALVKWREATGADDAEYADWIPMDKLPPLAFDHDNIIKVAMEAIRKDIFFEPVGFELLNELFSMPQLQSVYEAILGKSFDRRNFAKKMKHMGILEEATPEENIKARLEQEKERTLMAEKRSECVYMDLDTPIIHSDFGMEFEDCSTGTVTNAYETPPIKPMLASESIFSIIDNANAPKEKKQRGRRSSFFRLNKKKYNLMKKDDNMEF